jgi:dolichol-phosphate mannosyltransferase
MIVPVFASEKDITPPFLSIVLPAYNEEAVIPIAIPVVIDAIQSSKRFQKKPFAFELVVVDDGSLDRTLENLEILRTEFPMIRVIKMLGNQGHMNALEAGLRVARGHFVVTMDIDLQDPPSYIGQMIEIAELEGSDCVQTVRADRTSDSFMKKKTASLFYKIIKIVTGVNAIPHAADYRLLKRDLVLEIIKSPEVNKVLRFIIPTMNVKISILQIIRDSRVAGTTKYPYKKMISFAMDSVFGFSRRPLRIISSIGLLFSSLLGFGTIVTFILWIQFGAVPGWTSLIMLILSSNALILAALGIIGEYISKIFIQSIDRSRLRYTEI